jgi:tripartite ATP-independent transporter DctM subunit
MSTIVTEVVSEKVVSRQEGALARLVHVSSVATVRPIEFIAAAGMLAMTVVVFVSVFCRYVLHNSLPWAEEMSRFLLIYISLLGAAIAVERRAHLVVDVVAHYLPRYFQHTIVFLSDVLVATVLCFLVAEGWKLVATSNWLKSTAMGWPMGTFLASVPVGALLMLIYMAQRSLRGEKERFRGMMSVGLGVLVYALVIVLHPTFPSGSYQLVVLGLFFVIQVAAGVPVAFSMLSSSITFMILKGDIPLMVSAQVLAGGIDSFPLLAIPFFILAGALMDTGGISSRLVNLATVLVGWIRGGLAMVVVVAEYIFSGISGSTPADVSAIGSILIPSMKRAGYKVETAIAVVAAASSMGILVPPCIAMVVLGVLANVSVGALFIGGFLPAAVIALMLMGLIYMQAVRENFPREPKPTPSIFVRTSVQALVPLTMPVILFGGILGGITTPTEAASVAVVYGMLVGLGIYREIKWRDLPKVLADSAVTTGVVMFLIGAASLLAWNLTREGLPNMLSAAITSISTSPWIFLLVSNLMFMLLGAVLEGLPVLIIMVPLLMPLVQQLGIDPIHYGIVTIMAVGIGVFLPPVGVCFFIACSIGKAGLLPSTRAFLPYLAVLIVGLLVITFVPQVTLVLPQWVYGR